MYMGVYFFLLCESLSVLGKEILYHGVNLCTGGIIFFTVGVISLLEEYFVYDGSHFLYWGRIYLLWASISVLGGEHYLLQESFLYWGNVFLYNVSHFLHWGKNSFTMGVNLCTGGIISLPQASGSEPQQTKTVDSCMRFLCECRYF